MRNTIMDIFKDKGVLLPLEGNKPLLLNNASCAWFVESGTADIFSVCYKEGEFVHELHHIFRADSGEIIFGIDSDSLESDVGLMVKGTIGTRLIQLNKSFLREIAQDKSFVHEIAQMTEKWLRGLADGVFIDLIPKKVELLEPPGEIAFSAKEIVLAKENVVWFRHLDGDSLFMGRDEFPITKSNIFFPIPYHTWIELTGEARLDTLDTIGYMELEHTWEGLEWFHRTLLDYIVLLRHLASDVERERLRQKEESEARILQSSFSMITSVMDKDKPQTISTDGEGDNLFALFKIIGDFLGVEINSDTVSSIQSLSKNPLADIARASGLQVRRVALKENWHLHDIGPLLAYKVESGNEQSRHSVALLPVSAKQYELHDPVDNTKVFVTSEVASSLDYFAFTLYRPFPGKSLTVGDVLKFGLSGISCRRDIFMIFLMGILSGLFALAIPVATGIIFDTYIPGAQRNRLLQLSSAMLVGILANTLFQITQKFAMVRFEARVLHDIQAAVWDRLLSIPVTFFSNYTAGDLANRAMGIDAIGMFMSGAVIQSVMTGIFSIFSFALLFWYNVKLALIAVVLVLASISYTLALGYKKVLIQRKEVEVEGRISGMVLQFLTGISKLRISGTENRAYYSWIKEFVLQRRLAFGSRYVDNILATANAAFPVIASMTIFACIVSIDSIELTTGKFLAFNSAFTQFLTSMLAMSSTLLSILALVPLYERAKPILETLPEVNAAKVNPGELSGEIEVSHVEFCYRDDMSPTLKDVSFHVFPGEFVALVGPSGSGKSTLLRLLLGFETPSSGTVFYDGNDLAGLDLRAVRQQLGVVLQSSQLMSGTIQSNIVSNSGLTIEDAWAAARMAGFDADIEQMPMGMHTVISYGGGTLSGGQQQRLLIARALIRKPRIIIFDEATSALDNKTQSVVSKSLENLQATRIVIAHRLSTIINADRIILISNGTIVQNGNYQELIQQDGLFAEMAARQLV